MSMNISMCHLCHLCHINQDVVVVGTATPDRSGLKLFHFQCSLEEIQQQNPQMYDNKVCMTMNQKLPTLSHKFQ